MKPVVTCQYRQDPHELDDECVNVTYLPPVLLLDIDGVSNANKPGWGAAPLKTRCADLTIRWAPQLVVRLNQLRRAGVDIRWCSTWCGFPDQLAALEVAIGLRLPSAFGDRRPSETWGDLKVRAAIDALTEGRRIVWVDDDEVGAGRDLFPQIAKAETDGRALLIQPRSVVGLQPVDMDAIEAFCGVTAAA